MLSSHLRTTIMRVYGMNNIAAAKSMNILEEVDSVFKAGYLEGRREAREWTMCSEKMPGVGENVILCVGKRFCQPIEGLRREDGTYYLFRNGRVAQKKEVKCWMPLPEPHTK